jgi:lauroyl/myristoyl acyltransferase
MIAASRCLSRMFLEEANGMIQDWIVLDPGQWLWLHRRWDLKVS